ncbi:MAG: CAP domain-containing protein [Clostridium chrysemydis]|uniref:CAP domain-containing protein n=1 Tax=Clostridium chrysemydis TaxID=2665504 RepID=UPI003F321487
MKRKAILSVLLGAVTLITVGCTNTIDNQSKNGENNTKIVEDNNSIKNSSDNNKSKDDNAREKEEKVNESNNKEENKTGTSISKKEKNKDKLVEVKDNKTSNKSSEGNSKKVEDNSNKESNNTSNNEAKPKVQRYYSNNNTTNNQKDNSNVNNNTNNNVTNESSYMSAVESEIINIVNSERAKAGKKALSYNATMQSYGRQKSKDMAINNYFSHEDLSNRTEYDKMKSNGVKINAWGENIAYMSNRSPEVLAREFMNNWMNSPGHRANILSGNFTGIGVGVYKSGDKIYATQEFCA